MSVGDDPVQTGRRILTALYLCMLGVCFLVPIFFYFRMHCDERRNRQLRDIEIAGITQAMNDSQILQREESRAARRKYREERRARIVQLFTPVRMILTEDNFISSQTGGTRNIAKNTEEEIAGASHEETDAAQNTPQQQDELEEGSHPLSPDSSSNTNTTDCAGDHEIDEFILVPRPGLPNGAAFHEFNSNNNLFTLVNNHNKANQQQQDNDLRRVPNECSICLCEYEIGSDIVWSSNPQCEHVFHTKCIEQWLMKQREGPLCPCCRRDFVIDPFDCGSGDINDLEKGNSSAFARNSDEIIGTATSDVEETVLAMVLAASLATSMGRIDELGSSVIEMPLQLATDDSNDDGI